MASDDTIELVASAARTTVTEIRSVIVFGVSEGEAEPEPMLVLLINGELALYFGLEAIDALDGMFKEVPKRIEVARVAVIPLPVKPAVRQTSVAPAAAIAPDLAAVAANAWTRPHTMERGEISAAIIAVLLANGAPMDRRQARLACLLCLEPHLLAPMLDRTEKAHWARIVGGDAKKAGSASIDATAREWGAALSGLRGRERVLEDLQQNTWALGTGTDAIDTSGWPSGRAGFVVNVLRRLQQSAQMDAIILKLPTNVQQWLASAA